MFTTAGSTSWATMTTGVRRAPVTVAGIGVRGWRSVVCDSANGLHAKLTANRRKTNRSSFMVLKVTSHRLAYYVRLKLIYNPAAGRGRARHHARDVERHLQALGAQVTSYASVSPADLTRAAAESS